MQNNGLAFKVVDRAYDPTPLLDLVETAHKESRFGYIPFSQEKARRILDQALTDEAHNLIAVAELGQRPVGYIFATAGEHYVGRGGLLVTINTVYVSESSRGSLLGGRASIGLLRAVGRWSKGIGATEVLMHVTSGVETERTSRTLAHLGFHTIGGSFVAQVK